MCKVGYLYDKSTNECIKLDYSTPYICNTLSYLPESIYIGYILYSTVINNNIYVFTSSNSVFKWNASGMSWDLQDNYLTNYINFSLYDGLLIKESLLNTNSFFTYKNKVFIYNNNTVSGSIYVYDPTLNAEDQIIYNNIIGLTLDGKNDILMCISNDYLYLFGGYYYNNLNSNVYVYNLNNINQTPYIVSIPNLQFSYTIGSKIYCDDQTNKLYLFNISVTDVTLYNYDYYIYIFDTSNISSNKLEILSKTPLDNKIFDGSPISRYYVYKNNKYIILYNNNSNICIYNINNINKEPIINQQYTMYPTQTSLYQSLFAYDNLTLSIVNTNLNNYSHSSFTINGFFFVVNNMGIIIKLDFSQGDVDKIILFPNIIVNPCYPIGNITINNNNNTDNLITFYTETNYGGSYISFPYDYNTIYLFKNSTSSIPSDLQCLKNYNTQVVDTSLLGSVGGSIKSIKFGNNINVPESMIYQLYFLVLAGNCVLPYSVSPNIISTSNIYDLSGIQEIYYVFFNPSFTTK